MEGTIITMNEPGVLMLLDENTGLIADLRECVKNATVINTTCKAVKYYNMSMEEATKKIKRYYPDEYKEYTDQFPKLEEDTV